LEDNNATRAATSQRVGPWFVLQSRNPSAPGMHFDTLKSLIHRHLVTSRSVVRGPTTGQLWRLASKVRGLSREFGQCYDCGEDIERDDTVCPHCDRLQTLPDTPEARGEALAEPVKPAVGSAVPGPVAEAVSPTVEKKSGPARESIVVNHLEVDAPPRPSAIPPIQAVERTGKPPEPEPITVMSSDSDDRTPAELLAEEHDANRHIPKDDLLTARDVAKAFLLEFGPTVVTSQKRVTTPPRPRRQVDDRKLKTAASLVGMLLAAGAIWPIGHVVAGWFQSSSTPSIVPTPVASSLAPADSKLANAHLRGEVLTPVPVPATAPLPVVSNLESTGSPLDLGIAGAGYFRIRVGDSIGYTRNGSLARNAAGDLIVSIGSGYPLLPTITVPTDATKVTVAADGTVSYMGPDTGDQEATVGQIQLCGFANPQALKHRFGSVYSETKESGSRQVQPAGTQGMGQLMIGYVDIVAMNADSQPSAIAAAPVIKPPAMVQPVMYVNKPMVTTPPPAAAAPQEPSVASDDPRTLMQAGMDAEAHHHFAAAVADYERIESLPSDNWPASLPLRLKLARKELNGELR
jgi:hypothetical protein